MSMQKLKGIKSVGAYTAQRGVAEKLLLIEEEIMKDESIREKMDRMRNIRITVPEIRASMHDCVKQYFKEKKVCNITHEDLKQYLRMTIEGKHDWEQEKIRGAYTSELFNHLTGELPFEIDLQNQPCKGLFYCFNSERTLNIQNLYGDSHFNLAGAYNGFAIINTRNRKGNDNFQNAGTMNGNLLIIEKNPLGNENFWRAGANNGKAFIVAKDSHGKINFRKHESKIVLYSSQLSETRIEGVDATQREEILTLIAQNTPSEDIMDYLRRST